MNTLVFVYGTLKRGGSNHHWIQSQRFVGMARTLPEFRLYDLGGYPGMVGAAPGQGSSIEGEVWEVDPAGLAKLDVLEDVAGGEYARVKVPLEGAFSTQDVEGYLYLLDVTGRRDIGTLWACHE